MDKVEFGVGIEVRVVVGVSVSAGGTLASVSELARHLANIRTSCNSMGVDK